LFDEISSDMKQNISRFCFVTSSYYCFIIQVIVANFGMISLKQDFARIVLVTVQLASI